ncbi:hypothetical protein F2P81_005411 [Scophthalmus maximus]|uniref:Uncharacterized protein n=1 Tax=Scophthalmus maximus TaxID=52904 RepID=A0A6A4TAH0_SCOMX|nr:hypothetical protein F2P81_005411 [Scophthalmus maximus]
MMDDALSESDNIFSRSPKPGSGGIRGRPALASFSVCEVQLPCSVTPRTTPTSAAPGLCKLELTTGPCPLQICTPATPRRADNTSPRFNSGTLLSFLPVTGSKIEKLDCKQKQKRTRKDVRSCRRITLPPSA